jgi:predicted transcriptional regulator
MPNENSPTQRRLVAEIVAAYVGSNQIATDQVPSLIATVQQALSQFCEPPTEQPDKRTPAVSARQSVHHDHVICMDCGYRGQMLKRHLTVAHGLTASEYRARWSLPLDHPITAPGYSEQRSGIA